ncbi:bifunctional Rhomboid-like superfamily/Peptidase S54 [Babesia duncani]|uniref:Bifunctional Rhomboid-like superfamily/Peptidase S54 n=1 Tax=Babesia duncani TaxID=323732 RepID=A0AAD9PM76_9APIC|nr:bifunctional Rhomboid-like superfamily/Peptidase S54 [Babesia duncani]
MTKGNPAVTFNQDVKDQSHVLDNERFKSVVSRHRKFTRAFEHNLNMCSDKLNAICQGSRRNTNLVKCVNSVFNNSLTLEDLQIMAGNYEECEICTGVHHCKAVDARDSQGQNRSREALAERRTRMTHIRRFVNMVNMRPSLPDIFNNSTLNFIQKIHYLDGEQAKKQQIDVETENEKTHISECVIYLVNEDVNYPKMSFLVSFKNALVDIAKEISNNFFPLLRLFSVTILITFIQWIIYLVRVLYYRTTYNPSIEYESLKFGIFSGRLLRDELAVHRIFSSTFFHNSLGHLIISTIMHFRFCSVFERIHGASTTLVVYFLSSAYGMVAVCWNIPKVFQANGFCGDWGIAGALLSRFFIFPYLFDREHNHLLHMIASFLCLLFVKNIESGSTIVIATHLIAAFGGYCLGIMIYSRLRDGRCCGLNNILVDFFCSFTLMAVPVVSIFMLFIVDTNSFAEYVT